MQAPRAAVAGGTLGEHAFATRAGEDGHAAIGAPARLHQLWWIGGVVAFVLIYFDPQAALINTTVNEPVPVSAGNSASSAAANSVITAPQRLAHGSFRSLEHHTTGTARLLRLADGSAVLRLENLDTSNGPDVHVTLSPTPPDRGNRDYGDYVDLGSLKANHGNQNYPIPAGTDLTRFKRAVVWCRRFTVGFGVAPLS